MRKKKRLAGRERASDNSGFSHAAAAAAGLEPVSRRQVLEMLVAVALYTLVIWGVAQATTGFYMWNGHDMVFSFLRLRLLAEQWNANGIGSGNWLPSAFYDYGYPLFQFYPPLAYQFGAALMVFAKTTLGETIRINFFFPLWLSGLAMFGLAWVIGRRHACRRIPWWGLAAAAIYALAPYHLADIFVRGSLAESWSWATLAYVLLAIEISRDRPWAGIFLVAAAQALLILSHNIIALYGTVFLGVYALLTARQWTWVARVAAGGALGMAMSAFFWLPALKLMPLVNGSTPGQLAYTGEFIQDHHLAWLEYLIEQHGRGWKIAGVSKDVSFNAGLTLMCAGTVSAFALFRPGLTPVQRRNLGVCLGLWVAALFAVSPWMQWKHVPQLFLFIQYPWRLLLLSALLGTVAMLHAAPALNRWTHPLAFAIPAVLLGLPPIKPTMVNPMPGEYNDQTLNLSLPSTHPEYVALVGTVLGEYLPKAVDKKYIDPAFQQQNPVAPDRLEPQGPGFTLQSFVQAGSIYDYSYRADRPMKVIAHLIDFPGWRLWMDGRPADERLQKTPDGLLLLNLPVGSHKMRLAYDESPIGRVARRLSLAALAVWCLGWIGLAVGQWKRKARHPQPVAPAEPCEDETKETQGG
jgi:hypothetical protein